MAFKEVDPGPMPDMDSKFYSFKAIGDRFAGVYVSQETGFNKFGKSQTTYTFKNKEGTWKISANYDLNRRLQKAALQPGYKVLITYVTDMPIEGQNTAMKQFKVLVDDDVKPAAPKPPPPPPPAEDDFEFP